MCNPILRRAGFPYPPFSYREVNTVYASDVEQLKEIIYNVVGALPGVTRSDTAIVLEETRLPLTRGLGEFNAEAQRRRGAEGAR